MGGLYGVNLFHPEDIRYNTVQPHVMFSSFRLFNQQVEVGKEYDGQVVLKNNLNSGEPLTLDYKQNVFTIGLATDCYILPNKTRYVFKMEGFNDSWMTLPEGESQVTYTNLSPGKYNLVVKAVNSDDVAGAEALLDRHQEHKVGFPGSSRSKAMSLECMAVALSFPA